MVCIKLRFKGLNSELKRFEEWKLTEGTLLGTVTGMQKAFEFLLLSWPENQGILFFIYFSNISNEPDIFHGCIS